MEFTPLNAKTLLRGGAAAKNEGQGSIWLFLISDCFGYFDLSPIDMQQNVDQKQYLKNLKSISLNIGNVPKLTKQQLI